MKDIAMDAQTTEAGLFLFSTNDVNPQDRVAALHDVLGRIYLRSEFLALNEEPARVSLRKFQCGLVSLLYGESDAFGLARRAEFLSDGDGDFRFVLPQGVAFEYESGSISERMDPGEAMVVFNGEASTTRYFGRCRCNTLRIGHELLLDAAHGLKLQPMWRIESGSPRLRLLSSYLRWLRRQWPSNDYLLDSSVGRHLIQLVALALSPDGTKQWSTTPAVRAARLATIRADVLENIAQKRLSVGWIARRYGVSDRYIHRLFEETGETFGAFVERVRLERAFALLSDSANATMRISGIALSVGYNEPSTFNRAFRRRFGDTPSSVRNGDRQQSSNGGPRTSAFSLWQVPE
jgi:AraC-like DNA-binding protein